MASSDWLEKDFYKILGVDKNISDADLKKKYRQLARKYHPDANKDNKEAEKRFKEISEAYSVLSDPKQRKEYDQIRTFGRGARFGGSGAGQGAGFEDIFSNLFGGGFSNQGGGFGSSGERFKTAGGFEDIFANFGRGGSGAEGVFGNSGFAGFSNTSPPKGKSVKTNITISLMQAIKGDTITLQSPGGSGKTFKTKIPQGIKDGTTLRLKSKGLPSNAGGANGDLLLTINIEKNHYFSFDGKNIALNLPISVSEAVFGGNIEIFTPEGNITLKIPPLTPSGAKFRVKLKTLPFNQIITTQIIMPKKLSKKAKEAMEIFANETKDLNIRENITL